MLMLFTLALNLTSCKGKNNSNGESEIDKKSLSNAINEFNKAFKEGNVATLELMITDNYTHTNGNSTAIGKTEWLSYLRKREDKIKSGNLEVIEYQMSEIKIEFHGNMAVVAGKISVVNKEKEDIQKSEYRVTNIWVNKNGKWKRVAFHDGKIK